MQNEYKYRINKVIDYIEQNIDQKFTLAELAAVSNFSKFHFSRIFQGVVGESPFQLIQRLRLEKAASFLLHTNDTISNIAMQCGFRSLPVFSKNFKLRFSCSATDFRKIKKSNFNKANSIIDKTNDESSLYFCYDSKTIKYKVKMEINQSIEIKELQDMSVVYIRHIGPYQGDSKLFYGMYDRLFKWAGPRGLLENNFQTAIVYHDDVNVADKEKLRTSVCLTAPKTTEVDGEVGKMIIEKGTYVVARFEVKAEQFQTAWDYLMGSWFPSSGYQPGDKPCFELYSEEQINGVFKVDICVPLKKL